MPQEPEPVQDTREIYADFIFAERQRALDFAGLVAEHDGTMSVAYASGRERWRATVRRRMEPLFRDITVWLTALTARAATAGGELP
jgi:hypothetical protein